MCIKVLANLALSMMLFWMLWYLQIVFINFKYNNQIQIKKYIFCRKLVCLGNSNNLKYFFFHRKTFKSGILMIMFWITILFNYFNRLKMRGELYFLPLDSLRLKYVYFNIIIKLFGYKAYTPEYPILFLLINTIFHFFQIYTCQYKWYNF